MSEMWAYPTSEQSESPKNSRNTVGIRSYVDFKAANKRNFMYRLCDKTDEARSFVRHSNIMSLSSSDSGTSYYLNAALIVVRHLYNQSNTRRKNYNALCSYRKYDKAESYS